MMWIELFSPRNANRSGEPPQVPFVVAQYFSDCTHLDLEQYLAWAWILSKEIKDD